MPTMAELADMSEFQGIKQPKKKPTMAEMVDLSEFQKSPHQQENKAPQWLQSLAKHLPSEETLKPYGDIAGHFNRALEGTGLPGMAKGFLGSGVEMGRGVANLMPGVNIPKQHYPELANEEAGNSQFQRLTPEILGSFGMLNPAMKGIEAGKKAINLVPYLRKVPELLKGAAVAAPLGAAISPEDRKLGAAIGAGAEVIPAAVSGVKNYVNDRRIIPKEKALQEAIQNAAVSKEERELTQAETGHEFGAKTAPRLMLTAADKAKQLEEAMRYKQHHVTPEMQQMRPGEQTTSEIEHNLTQTNKAVSDLLKPKQAHGNRLAQEIVPQIEGIQNPETRKYTGGLKQEVGNLYNNLENDLLKEQIYIPATADMKQINKELENLSLHLNPEEKESFKKILIESATKGKGKNVSAKDYLRSYRSVRQLANDASDRAYTHGVTIDAQTEWLKRAKDLNKTADKMANLLTKNLGGEWKDRLQEANYRYATEIAPLYENPTYQQMKLHGRASGDLITNLSGTTPGNNILNGIIQQNPNLSRLVIGQSYAKKPHELHNANELIIPYLQSNPQIARLMQQQAKGHEALSTVKQQEEILNVIKDIPKLKEQVERSKILSKKLQETKEVEGLDKAEVKKRKQELDEAMKKKASTFSKGKGFGMGTASTTLIYEIIKHLLK